MHLVMQKVGCKALYNVNNFLDVRVKIIDEPNHELDHVFLKSSSTLKVEFISLIE